MKAYAITTGTVFGLIVVAHIWRIVVEGFALAKDPVFVVVTVAAGVLLFWSLRVLKSLPTM